MDQLGLTTHYWLEQLPNINRSWENVSVGGPRWKPGPPGNLGQCTHQGTMDCDGSNQMQACTAATSQTSIARLSITVLLIPTLQMVRGEDQPLQLDGHHLLHSQQHQYYKETPIREQPWGIPKKPVKGSKASDRDAWRNFNTSLHTTLQHTLRGSTTAKHLQPYHLYGRQRIFWRNAPEEDYSQKEQGMGDRSHPVGKGEMLLAKIMEKSQRLRKGGLEESGIRPKGSRNTETVHKKQEQASSGTPSSMPKASWRRKGPGQCRLQSMSWRNTSNDSSVTAKRKTTRAHTAASCALLTISKSRSSRW